MKPAAVLYVLRRASFIFECFANEICREIYSPPRRKAVAKWPRGCFASLKASRGGYHVKQNMVNSSVRTWYTIINIKIFHLFLPFVFRR